jgi:hypothetical protein
MPQNTLDLQVFKLNHFLVSALKLSKSGVSE